MWPLVFNYLIKQSFYYFSEIAGTQVTLKKVWNLKNLQNYSVLDRQCILAYDIIDMWSIKTYMVAKKAKQKQRLCLNSSNFASFKVCIWRPVTARSGAPISWKSKDTPNAQILLANLECVSWAHFMHFSIAERSAFYCCCLFVQDRTLLTKPSNGSTTNKCKSVLTYFVIQRHECSIKTKRISEM